MSHKIAICVWGGNCGNGFDEYNKNVVNLMLNLYSIDLYIATYDDNNLDIIMDKYKPSAISIIDRKLENVKDKNILLRNVANLVSINARANSINYKFMIFFRTGIRWITPLSKLSHVEDKFNVSCNAQCPFDDKLWIFDANKLSQFIQLLENNSHIEPCNLQIYIERIFGTINYLLDEKGVLPLIIGTKEEATTGRVVIALWGKTPEKGISASLNEQINIYKRIKRTDRILITAQNPWINTILLNFMPTTYSFMLSTDNDLECLNKILKSINARSINDRIVLLRCTCSPIIPISEWELDDRNIKYMDDNSMDSIIMPGSLIGKLEELIEKKGCFPV